jgi:peptidoglycan/LPS O-acetylase OafA/YrhL
MNGQVIHFPGLNGLRAIAAIAVVISHTTVSLTEFSLDPYIFGVSQDGTPQGLSLAGYAVSLFFVLSGFLITYLLQVEKDRGDIQIRKFYLRRILRIWPLYYLYLIAAIFAITMLGLSVNIESLILYIFYAANVPIILGITLPFLAHYWSLGVEEQFYLFWPWVNKNFNSLTKLLVMVMILMIGSKVALHFLYPNSLMEVAIHITRFHCMMIGALGAILYKTNHKTFLVFVDNKLTQWFCWLIMFMVAINQYHVASVIDSEIISVVSLFLIIGQCKIKNRIINLDQAVMDFLGKISYGIYVIHPLLIYFLAKPLSLLTLYSPLKYLVVYFAVLLATILLSHLSYAYFEKPFLNLKRRFEVVPSSDTRNI